MMEHQSFWTGLNEVSLYEIQHYFKTFLSDRFFRFYVSIVWPYRKGFCNFIGKQYINIRLGWKTWTRPKSKRRDSCQPLNADTKKWTCIKLQCLHIFGKHDIIFIIYTHLFYLWYILIIQLYFYLKMWNEALFKYFQCYIA